MCDSVTFPYYISVINVMLCLVAKTMKFVLPTTTTKNNVDLSDIYVVK